MTWLKIMYWIIKQVENEEGPSSEDVGEIELDPEDEDELAEAEENSHKLGSEDLQE